MTVHSRRSLAVLVAVLWLVPCAAQWQFDGVDRVVALSDIHGAHEHMVRTLQNAAVIDDELAWSGESTHLVIVGDILDRGPDSRAAMDLLMRLEDEAAAAGGRVHVVIGNHEAMNLVGDLRYVSRSEYAAFAGDEDAAERDRWFQAYLAKRAPGDKAPSELRAQFDQSFPAGYFAHRRAFAADGRYGAWLLEKPVIVVINGTAFVHGGLSPMVGKLGLHGVNERLRGELAAYVGLLPAVYSAGALLPTDNFYRHAALLDAFMIPLDAPAELVDGIGVLRRLWESDIHSPDGPLWYRGNAACSVLVEADRLHGVLESIGATRVVIGHTPTPGRRILERFGGTVIEVDTGMYADYYRGSGNALVLEGGGVAVVNEAGTTMVEPEPHPRRVGQRPDGDLSAAEIEALLLGGDIVSTGEDEAGTKIVKVSDGRNTVEATFAPRVGRAVFPDAAAYRLDRLLNLDMVPVSVVRSIGRQEGSLQFRVTNSIDELSRRDKGYGAGAQCPLDDQWEAMFVFDVLLSNAARSGRTIRYSPDNWQLLLTGHGAALTTDTGRPPHLKNVPLALNDGWRRALAALTDEVLAAELGDVLDKRRLEALAARRDALLELREQKP